MWQVQVRSISWNYLARNIKGLIFFSAATIWLYVMKIFKSSFDIVNISRNLRQTFLLAFGGTKKIQGGWGEFPRSHIESFIEEHNGFNSSYGISPGIWCNSRVKIVPFQNILTWQFCFNSAISAHGIRVNDNQCCQDFSEQVFTSWEMLKRNYCCFQGFAI